jgi:hypothetical protein
MGRNLNWSFSMRYLATLVVLAAFSVASYAADLELGGLKSKVPDGWKEESPTSTMRLQQFKLPKAEGDKEDAELVVFRFPKGASGSVEANLERQVKKFKAAEGKDKVESKVEKIKIGSIDATYQDVQGVYLSKFPPFAPDAKITEKPNYRQLYVLLTSDSGDYYVTVLGPTKTIEKHKKDLEAALKNFK